MKKLLILLLVMLGAVPLTAKVKLPSLIGDHMVLQRDTVVQLWGETAPGRSVRIRPSWSRDRLRTTADSLGRWLVRIPTPEAGGPYRIEIDDGDKTCLDSVMIGEVWVCSGQSNMALTMHGEQGEHTEGSLQALLESSRYASIRLFKMGNVSAPAPREDCPGEWAVPDWERISDFSAIAYHFGRTLTDALQIPIGLISANWGASSIEAWMPEESLKKIERECGVMFRERPGMMKQKIPSALYNGMIHPLERYAVRGFIWYQGEGNRADYRIYDRMMNEMVRAWRRGWGDTSMPFYFVELAPYRYDDPQGIDRPLLVETQHRAAQTIPHSGIVGTLDLGDSTTIHPPRKQEIGQRLGLLALTDNYRIRGLEAHSPRFRSVRFGKDNAAVVSFEGAPYGLRSEGTITGFELCGQDSIFQPAEARILPGQSAVRVTSPQVPHPVAVRYGFRNWSRGNLYNTSGIPVLLFRTDTGEQSLSPDSVSEWDNPQQGTWVGFDEVEIPSSLGGTPQRAYFRKATGPRRRPLVVSLHTWSGDYTQQDPLAAEAAARNWNYIHPDFRGPNNRPQACGSREVIADLEDAVRYAVEHGNTDPEDVHVIGVSGGGYATLLAYMTMKYPVKSFSAWAPISDLKSWYEESVGRRQHYAEDILRCAPADNEPDTIQLRQRSPLHLPYPTALRRGARLCIYEGIHDGYKGSVPITHAINMYNYVARTLGAADSSLVSDREALRLVAARQNPDRDIRQTLCGRAVHLSRNHSTVSLTLFEGGHEQLPQALSLLPVEESEYDMAPGIWTLGDSNGEKRDGWVDQLQALLPQADIHNNSRSGRTIGFDNNGDSHLNALHTLQQDLDEANRYFRKRRCDVIVVCLGTNDTKAVYSDHQQKVVTHFRELIERVNSSPLVRRYHPLCLFMTPPPMDDAKVGAKYTGGNRRLRALVPVFSAIAEKSGWQVIDLYHPLQPVFKAYTRDGVHMDGAGQRIVARKIIDALLAQKSEPQR